MSDVPRPATPGPTASGPASGPVAPARAARRRWLLVSALLAPAVVLPLAVPLYDREDPAFLGFPFFHWFQFLLIVAAVALTVPAYLLAGGADRAQRVAHGLPPEPDGSGAHRDESRR